jgi:SNF2 family DNA or RNA helicase
MKNSMLDGKRLIELPDKTISLVKLEFSEEEREIYKMVTKTIPFFVNCADSVDRLKPELKQTLTAISVQGQF